MVRGQERLAGHPRLDALLLGVVDEVVEVPLQLGEPAVDRQGSGHVGGVEVAALDTHVEQDQLPGLDRPGVVDPVQRGGVLAAADDRVVAHVVAHRPGPALEGALDPALAVLEHLLPLPDAVLEAEGGDVARLLQLGDLPVVLDQPELTDHPLEVLVHRVIRGHHPVHVGRDPAQHAGLRGAVGGEPVLERVDVAALDAQRVGQLVQGRTPPDPELAVLAVAEELVGVARRAGAGVENGLAVLDDQHRVAGLVAGEVGVGGVRAELVVGVVGPDLEGAGGQHQPFAGEHPGQLVAPGGGPVGHRLAGQVELTVAPPGAHEGGVRLRNGWVVGLDVQLLCGLRVVLTRLAEGLAGGLLGHPRHSTPQRGCRAEAT